MPKTDTQIAHRLVDERLVSSVGLDVRQTAASVRSGIARFSDSKILDQYNQPLVLAQLPNEILDTPLDPSPGRTLTNREKRLLQLLLFLHPDKDAGGTNQEPLPLYLGLADIEPFGALDQDLAELIPHWLPSHWSIGNGACIFRGAPSGILALQQGLANLDSQATQQVMVGASGSFLELGLLARLDGAQRIKSERHSDGFIPGEGAATQILQAGEPQAGDVIVKAIGTGFEAGHRHSEEPMLGDGLSEAVKMAVQGLDKPVASVFGTWNGESQTGKQWGIAQLRNSAAFAEALALWHPAENYGDPGGAASAMLISLACQFLRREWCPSPALIWASSDFGHCAAVTLERIAH